MLGRPESSGEVLVCCWQVRMDGSDGRTDLRMSIPRDTGVFVRSTAKPDGSMLLMGARAACTLCALLSWLVNRPCLSRILHSFHMPTCCWQHVQKHPRARDSVSR